LDTEIPASARPVKEAAPECRGFRALGTVCPRAIAQPEDSSARQSATRTLLGPTGEVTNAALASAMATALAGTANNTNWVPTMDTPFTNDPPTLADLELMRVNYNQLVLALRR
jgi:hypothetical protein